MRKNAKDEYLLFTVRHQVHMFLKNPFEVRRRCPFQNAKGLVAVYAVCIASGISVRSKMNERVR